MATKNPKKIEDESKEMAEGQASAPKEEVSKVEAHADTDTEPVSKKSQNLAKIALIFIGALLVLSVLLVILLASGIL